jgi:hypothetical protein
MASILPTSMNNYAPNAVRCVTFSSIGGCYVLVAIVPKVPPERMDSTTAIDADVVLTWADIRDLAKKLMGPDHYVTVRLHEAVRRSEEGDEADGPYFEGTHPFKEMRNECRKLGNKIQVGYVGGEAALLKLSLVEAENRKWKWRYPETGGRITPGSWLPGARWLEIVESTRGFGGGGA